MVNATPAFSLDGNALPYRVMRRVGLIPREGLGILRRALFFSLFAWLPIAIWALLRNRVLPGPEVEEPLLAHFGVHVRCLVAIPLLIYAQGLASQVTARLMPRFERSGVLPHRERARLDAVFEGMRRLQNSAVPWIIVGTLAIAWTALGPLVQDYHQMTWSAEPDARGMHEGFGGFWFIWVARPIYIALVLAWVWRISLLALLFARIARLDLELVPTHADRAGGLGFVERFAAIESPVILALSSVLCAHWAHQILYHGETLASFAVPAVVFVASVLLLFVMPFLMFTPRLMRTKLDAGLEYGRLVGDHGRLVRRRWIDREPVENAALLEAPEIGPVADTVALYEAVKRMRLVPVGRPAASAILVPVLAPMVLVAFLEFPVLDVLKALMHALG